MRITLLMLLHRLFATVVMIAVVLYMTDLIGGEYVNSSSFVTRRPRGINPGGIFLAVVAGWGMVMFSPLLGGWRSDPHSNAGCLWVGLGWFLMIFVPLGMYVAHL